jgi:hypothetical protein
VRALAHDVSAGEVLPKSVLQPDAEGFVAQGFGLVTINTQAPPGLASELVAKISQSKFSARCASLGPHAVWNG